MTTISQGVNASTVTLTGLDALEVGTTIAWDGQTVRYGELFSALDRETPLNSFALVSGGGAVDLLQYQPDSRYRLEGTLLTGGGSVADVLASLAAVASSERIVRFGAGLELDAARVRLVPAVALWTW